MAEITNPEAITFCNEEVRPIAEQMRDLDARMRSIKRKWFLGINSHFASATDTVEDGREAQGVSRLVASDVTALLGHLNDILTAFDVAGVLNEIEKPCVRPLT